MQHKQHYIGSPPPRIGLFVVLGLVVVIGGIVGLAFVDVPAPQTQVTQELDAKTFTQAK